MLATPTPGRGHGVTAIQLDAARSVIAKPDRVRCYPNHAQLKDDDEDDELGDDLDSSGDDEPPTDDLLLCQFEKVGSGCSL
jgi:hypothetical protein